MIGRHVQKIKSYLITRKFGQCGINVNLSGGSHFARLDRMSFGSHIYIGPKAFFVAEGGILIDDNVIVGPMVTIHSSNHNYRHSSTMLPYDGTTQMRLVHIKSNTWIGSNVCICPGATIGCGVVIGMGSVVSGDIPDLAICAGNPAKIIGYRDREQYDYLLSQKAFYLQKKKSWTSVKP